MRFIVCGFDVSKDCFSPFQSAILAVKLESLVYLGYVYVFEEKIKF